MLRPSARRVVFPAAVLSLLPITLASAEPRDLAPSAQVATIGKETVTFGQLPTTVQTDLAEIKRRHEERLRQLEIEYERARQALIERRANEFVDDDVLRREAQARSLTVPQLVAEVQHPAVTDADIQAFYAEHQTQINQPLEAVRQRIAQVLEKQRSDAARTAYVDSLREKYAARVTLEPMRQDVSASGPSRGPKDASVTIVEFADFQCPYCGKMAPVLKQLLERYPKDVRLVYRHLPLSDLHPNALQAATASVCAQEQGRFWEMHDALFADQGALSPDGISKTADKVQLRKTEFQACVAGHQAAEAVKADAQAATDAFVDGTPGLFINGRYFSGTISYERLSAIVNDELSRRGRPVPSG